MSLVLRLCNIQEIKALLSCSMGNTLSNVFIYFQLKILKPTTPPEEAVL